MDTNYTNYDANIDFYSNSTLGNTGIYKWTSPSGKSYVGQAENLEKRKYHFLLDPFKYNYSYASGSTKIDRARRKYNDFSKWKYEVVEYCDVDELDDLETYYISYYDTYRNGYNSTLGGGGIRGYHFTEEQIERKRASMKGKLAGDKHPNYGKHLSDDTKRRISDSLKGDKHPMYGKHLSEEQKNALKKLNQFNAKPVLQLTLEGEIINEFSSAKEAARVLNLNSSNIRKVIKGQSNHAGGYKWRYK